MSEPEYDPQLAKALFRPDAVALIGASADAAKNTGRPQRFLKAHGFQGEVIPINPNRAEVQGVPAYARLTDAPGGAEHAFIMVPTPHVKDAVADCASAGVRVATIYSDGFAESGAGGLALQEEIVQIARDGGVRLIGPNSMGIIDTRAGVTLTINAFLEVPELPLGRIGVISQSGSVIGTMLSRGGARGVGFSSLVSIGNESDIGVGEVLRMMAADEETDAILMFLEAVRDADVLGAAAREAFDAGKPVIAYKLGRSQVGREMAVSHSGAIAGPDASIDAFFRHHGILRVDMLETLFELPALVGSVRPRPGRRVSVVTTTGGGSAMVVDRLGAAGLELVPPSAELKARMAEFGLDLGDRRIIDLTMAGTGRGIYAAALEVLMHEPDSDAVVAVVGTSAQFLPDVAVEPITQAPKTGKPLAAFLVPQADRSLALLADAGVAGFRTPEACADGVRALLEWMPPRTVERSSDLPAGMAQTLAAEGGGLMSEAAAAAVFADLGIETVDAVHLSDPTAMIPTGLSYPVAVKVLSPDLPHKTEAGALALNIKDDNHLRTAMAEAWESAKAYAPQADLQGIMIQPMIKGLAEVLVGFRRDPEAGAVAVLAPGGVLAEIYGDAAVRPAPVDVEMAKSMIDEVRGLAPIRGYRNLPKGDLDALAKVIVNISRLAHCDGPVVVEAEINPLCVMAEGAGAIAVDALIRLGE